MTNPNSESSDPLDSGTLGIPEPEILYYDGDSDSPPHPIPPEFLPQAMAERDKIRAYIASRQQEQRAKQAENQSNPEGPK